ncbi:MAG: CPBP family intramembrane metalloprotease [Bacteroidetes bacterium]|nr:CPBP family intramembrane metalloprotease [Bacteroidota bacterium]
MRRFFRGILQILYFRAAKSTPGNLDQRILFSFIHFSFSDFSKTAHGRVVRYLYFYSGSLWSAILAHFCQ